MSIVDKNTTFLGYRRENGRVGVRNHVVILPLDDLSNAAAEAVAHNIKGTLAIPHPYGRLQFGADLDLHFRTLIGTGCNPNVAAVVVIGIEDGWTQKVVDGIKATGKPVAGFGIELHGDHDTITARQQGGEANTCSGRARSSARPARIHELWVAPSAARSDTTVRLRRQPHGRRRVRQAARRWAARCASARPPSSPAASRSSPRAAPTTTCASSSCACSTATRT